MFKWTIIATVIAAALIGVYAHLRSDTLGGISQLPDYEEIAKFNDIIDKRQASYYANGGKYEHIKGTKNIVPDQDPLDIEVQQYNGPRGVGYLIIYKMNVGTTTYVRYECRGNDCPIKTSKDWIIAQPINSIIVDN